METFDLKIITPDGITFSGKVVRAVIPTSSGVITVLPKHIPLISELKPGTVTMTTEEGESQYTITGGVLEVRKGDNVVLLADAAE